MFEDIEEFKVRSSTTLALVSTREVPATPNIDKDKLVKDTILIDPVILFTANIFPQIKITKSAGLNLFIIIDLADMLIVNSYLTRKC